MKLQTHSWLLVVWTAAGVAGLAVMAWPSLRGAGETTATPPPVAEGLPRLPPVAAPGVTPFNPPPKAVGAAKKPGADAPRLGAARMAPAKFKSFAPAPAAKSASPAPPAISEGALASAAVAPDLAPLSESAIDDALAGLPIGNIAFNTPEEIPLGETSVISLLLSLKEESSELASAVAGPGPIETARVQISNQMQASLSGLGFEVQPITPDRQAVSRRDRTQWRWQIRPVETDVQPLHLTLSAVVRVDGENMTRTIETFERTIHVNVPLTRRVGDFVAANYQYAASALLAPLAAAAWRRHRRKKAAAEKAAKSNPSAEASHAAARRAA